MAARNRTNIFLELAAATNCWRETCLHAAAAADAAASLRVIVAALSDAQRPQCAAILAAQNQWNESYADVARSHGATKVIAFLDGTQSAEAPKEAERGKALQAQQPQRALKKIALSRKLEAPLDEAFFEALLREKDKYDLNGADFYGLTAVKQIEKKKKKNIFFENITLFHFKVT